MEIGGTHFNSGLAAVKHLVMSWLILQLLAIAAPASPPAVAPDSSSPSATTIAVLAQPLPIAEQQPRLDRGKELFVRNCFVCHQFNGAGIPGVFPPLAKSDWLTGNLEQPLRAIVAGLSGEVVVLGKKYNGSMPPIGLNDEEVNQLEAKLDAVTPEMARQAIQKHFPSDDLVFVLIAKASEIAPAIKKYAPKQDTREISDPGFWPAPEKK